MSLRSVIVGSRVRRPIHFVRSRRKCLQRVSDTRFSVQRRASKNDSRSVNPRFRPSLLLFPNGAIHTSMSNGNKGQSGVNRAFSLLISLLNRFTYKDRSSNVSNVNQVWSFTRFVSCQRRVDHDLSYPYLYANGGIFPFRGSQGHRFLC